MLPVLLSIPHGGVRQPEELRGSVRITDRDLFDDSDPFVIQIYDLGGKVRHVVKTDVARAFVDMNRSLQDMPPHKPDGLVKSATCYGMPIYNSGSEPDESARSLLIKRYYMPYHRDIQRSIREMDVQLCLDCHSMASLAPVVSPDGARHKRPAFCISNWDGRTSSGEMIGILADCVSESFSIDRKDIHVNDPFHGGYITRTYGNNPVPWIQIEMNRNMYVAPPWFDEDSLSVDAARLRELNGWFKDSLDLFFSRV